MEQLALVGNPTIDIMAGDLETAPHFASTTQITDSNFGLNQALQTHGGALCHVMGDLTIQDTMFQENHAVSMGEGCCCLDKNQLSGLTVYSNTAERGGGIAIGYPYNYTPGRTIMGPIYLTVNSTISGSEFSWNEAIFRGGGLWADQVGWTNITKSTFSYNISDFTGGGIYQSHGDLSITNSNLAGNFALRGGGLYAEGTWTSDPVLDIKHTTIAHNTAFETTPVISRWGGGGLNVGGDINITNSLIALNSSIDCQIADSYTNWSESGTVDSDGECDAFLTEPNPALGPLSWDGGTPTYALLANSPLLDILSDCAGITDDQRGISRPQGSACDPGSYEFDPSDPPCSPPVPPSLPPI